MYTGVWLAYECTLPVSNISVLGLSLGVVTTGLLDELGYIRNWEAQNMYVKFLLELKK